jgi:hypothetical protein
MGCKEKTSNAPFAGIQKGLICLLVVIELQEITYQMTKVAMGLAIMRNHILTSWML